MPDLGLSSPLSQSVGRSRATSSPPQGPRGRCAQGTQYSYVLDEKKVFLFSNMHVVDILLQGLMFGYATDETEECMPLTIILAHKLNARMADLRRSGVLPWLRPDSKTQVSLLLPAPVEFPPTTVSSPGSPWFLSLLESKCSVQTFKELLIVNKTLY